MEQTYQIDVLMHPYIDVTMHQSFHIFTSSFAGSIYLLCEIEKENTDRPLLQQSATGNKLPNSSKRQCPGISCNFFLNNHWWETSPLPPMDVWEYCISKRPQERKILTSDMALKPWHKTRWNGHKRHKGELYIYRDMPFSSKREMTVIWNSDYGHTFPLLRGRI